MKLDEETLKSIVSFATKEISKERSVNREDLVNEIEEKFLSSEYESLSLFIRDNFYVLTNKYGYESLHEALGEISLQMIIYLENSKREKRIK